MTFDALKGLGSLALQGLIANNAPLLAKGMIVELLKVNQINVKKLVVLVTENRSLWKELPPEYYSKIQKVMGQVQNLDWLTVEWVIDAIRKDLPAEASLFLGWRKGRTWLERQIEKIKKEVASLLT